MSLARMVYKSKSLVQSSDHSKEKESPIRNSNRYKRVGGFQLIVDIFGNSSLLTFFVAVIIAVPLSFLWGIVDYCENQLMGICSDILTLYSCVLGLVITGFSIILLLNEHTIEKLTFPYKKSKHRWINCMLNTKTNPYDMLCSSFSVCFLFLLVNIVAIILYKNQPNLSCAPYWQFMSVKILSIMSAVFIVDVLFHLYEVGTFINSNHHEVIIKPNQEK